jgi:hypothetical protein
LAKPSYSTRSRQNGDSEAWGAISRKTQKQFVKWQKMSQLAILDKFKKSANANRDSSELRGVGVCGKRQKRAVFSDKTRILSALRLTRSKLQKCVGGWGWRKLAARQFDSGWGFFVRNTARPPC